MKYQSLHTLVLLCFMCFLSGCKQTPPSQIKYEKSFDEIAQMAVDSNKSFCIILSDPECPPCETLHNHLFEEISISTGEKVIFNIVDVSLPQNKWYLQLLASKTLPSTLIFSPQGELEAVIQGTNRKSLECIKNTLEGGLDCSLYNFSTLLSKFAKQEDIIRSLNLILKAKAKVEKQEDATNELEESMNTLYYPYVLWLQIQNETNKGNEHEAIFLGKQMLTFQDPAYAVLYSDLYLESRYIINPHFDIRNAPLLEVDKDTIDLGKCKKGEKIELLIKLKNGGEDTLRIYDVSVSCSCLERLGKTNYTLEAGGEDVLRLIFSADYQGKIERKVNIVTNGVEPEKSVTILANVEE